MSEWTCSEHQDAWHPKCFVCEIASAKSKLSIAVNALEHIQDIGPWSPGPPFMTSTEKCRLIAKEALEQIASEVKGKYDTGRKSEPYSREGRDFETEGE